MSNSTIEGSAVVEVEHQCGGPRESCGIPGCDECGYKGSTPSRPYRPKPEHAGSVTLAACARAGLTEEQVIDSLFVQVEALRAELVRALETNVIPVVSARCSCPPGTFATDSPIPAAACPVHGANRPGQGGAQ